MVPAAWNTRFMHYFFCFWAVVDVCGPSSRDDQGGLRLDNVSEIRAPTAESAAYLMDAAIAARTVPGTNTTIYVLIHIYAMCS